jgi:hypothetical protein
MASNEDRIARVKQHIGFSDEPVLHAEGYWTIGYGRRLNDKRGGAEARGNHVRGGG